MGTFISRIENEHADRQLLLSLAEKMVGRRFFGQNISSSLSPSDLA
jgi:hypothetical protein